MLPTGQNLLARHTEPLMTEDESDATSATRKGPYIWALMEEPAGWLEPTK